MTDLNHSPETSFSTTHDDNGETNVRLLAREIKTDFRRVESASRKIRTTLNSPEGKRLFLRFFNSASLNMHFIAVIAPINLPSGEVEAVVAKLEELVEKSSALLNEALVHAEQLCHRNGIVDLATYDIAPLVVDARVHSKLGRHYLELICKIDQLMQILETLVIDEVMSNAEMASRKSKAKRAVRSIGSAIRQARFGLHKRINALAGRVDQGHDASDVPADSKPTAIGDSMIIEVISTSREVPVEADIQLPTDVEPATEK